MAIAFDATAGSGGDNLASVSFSHTCTGSDRLLLIAIHCLQLTGQVGSSVTYNGVAATFVKQTVNQGNRYMELWRLIAPATGANTLAVTFSASMNNVNVQAISFTGVDQTTPLGTSVAGAGNSTTPSVSVSAATNDLVFDAVTIEHAGTFTVGTGQTSRYNGIVAGGGFNKAAGSTEPGAASVTMDWSDTIGGNWVQIGVPIKPKVTSGTGIVPIAMNLYSQMTGR